MLRLITARRLQQLQDKLTHLEQTNFRLVQQVLHEQAQKELIAQGRDFFKRDAAEWKGRASRLIDQIGVTSGRLVGPAISEPAAPPPGEMRQVMRALSTQELRPTSADTAPAAPHILGVNEEAARAAIADLE